MRATRVGFLCALVGVFWGVHEIRGQQGTNPSGGQWPANTFIWPFPQGEKWRLTQSYGEGTRGGDRGHGYYALDLQYEGGNAATYRKPIGSTATGRVLRIENPPATSTTGYGRSVIIDHGNGYATRYAHFDEIHPDILDGGQGMRVNAMQQIGYTGHTGRCIPPGANHLHFEMFRVENGVLGARVKPEPILGERGFADRERELFSYDAKDVARFKAQELVNPLAGQFADAFGTPFKSPPRVDVPSTRLAERPRTVRNLLEPLIPAAEAAERSPSFHVGNVDVQIAIPSDWVPSKSTGSSHTRSYFWGPPAPHHGARGTFTITSYASGNTVDDLFAREKAGVDFSRSKVPNLSGPKRMTIGREQYPAVWKSLRTATFVTEDASIPFEGRVFHLSWLTYKSGDRSRMLEVVNSLMLAKKTGP